MVLDSIENAETYYALAPRIEQALRFVQTAAAVQLSVGKHAVDGEKLFASVERYTTRLPEQCFWEAHRNYIDVQFVAAGAERMDWASIYAMAVSIPYDIAKDRAVFTGSGQSLIVPARHFAIFWPHDVHMPCMAHQSPQPVHKIVMKVAVD